MAENVYECMFIFNANAHARNPQTAPNAIEEMVKSINGEVLASRLWNEQKLAYPINGHRKGAYWLTYVKCEGDGLVKFNRACQLNETIIRHMVVKLDPRLVDALVAVAKGEKPETEPAAEEEAPKEAAPKEEAAKTETVAATE